VFVDRAPTARARLVLIVSVLLVRPAHASLVPHARVALVRHAHLFYFLGFGIT